MTDNAVAGHSPDSPTQS